MKDKRVVLRQLGALGVGLTVTVVASFLTSLVNPIFFPFNFLISLGLGTAAGYGALKVLDPRTRQALIEAQTDAEYRQMLQEIAAIAMRTGDASQGLYLVSPKVSERLGNIARMTEMILERYRGRQRDFAGVSATLLIMQKFDANLAHYLMAIRGELFMDDEQREEEITEAERHGIPMIETALENLGKKLDAGEVLNKGVTKGTLESMLYSLNLIESLGNQNVSPTEKGDSDDQHT